MRIPEIKNGVGRYLRVWRAERNLTRRAAAKLLDISPQHWSYIEADKRHASPKVAAKLAKATGAPVEIFLGIQITR